jgi:hypothetical protein
MNRAADLKQNQKNHLKLEYTFSVIRSILLIHLKMRMDLLRSIIPLIGLGIIILRSRRSLFQDERSIQSSIQSSIFNILQSWSLQLGSFIFTDSDEKGATR